MADTEQLNQEQEVQETVEDAEFEKIEPIKEPDTEEANTDAVNEQNEEKEEEKPAESNADSGDKSGENQDDKDEAAEDEDGKVDVKTEKVMNDIKKEKEASENAELYFKDSTHQFLWIATDSELCGGESKNDFHAGHFLLGLFILLLQYALYIYLIIQTGHVLDDDLVAVKIDHETCDETLSNGFISDVTQFECEGGNTPIATIILSVIVLSQFVVSDLANAVQVMRLNGMLVKLAGLSIFIEGMLSIYISVFILSEIILHLQ